MGTKLNMPVIIIGLVIGGLFAWVISSGNLGFGKVAETQLQTQLDQGCNLAPSLDVTFLNADDDFRGTEITGVTTYLIKNGKYVGSKNLSTYTDFNKDDVVKVLASKSDYLDKVSEEITMKCGSNDLQIDMYATDDSVFRIFNTDGEKLTDSASGGAVNQSSSSSSITLDVKIDSNKDQSSGVLYIIVETNKTEVDAIVLSGFDGVEEVDVLDEHTEEFSGSSILKAFRIDALYDGETKIGTLKLEPKTGETIGADSTPVYITAYTGQDGVDDDGTFILDAVEDRSGDLINEDVFDFDLLVK